MVASFKEVDPRYATDEQGRSFQSRQASEKIASICLLAIVIILGSLAFVAGITAH